MTPEVERLLAGAKPITLDELELTAALTTRVDRTYVTDWTTLATVLADLTATHRVLEHGGRRTFRYHSVYFDSPDDLPAFRAHLQGRRRRFKVRSRHYVDSGTAMLELKVKGPRGETVKHRTPHDVAELERVRSGGRAFLAGHLAEAYPGVELPALAPVLRGTYRRFTFVGEEERVTCDFAVAFDGRAALRDGFAIIETKTARGHGAADRELRRLGVRPLSCSKFCVGVALLRDDVKANDLRWLLRRFFAIAPDPARKPAHA